MRISAERIRKACSEINSDAARRRHNNRLEDAQMAQGKDLQRTKEWLLQRGSITQKEAYHGFGNLRLAPVISTLRHRHGWVIETEMIHDTDPHGEPMHYGRYVLVSAPEVLPDIRP